jgi:hypothetical protein
MPLSRTIRFLETLAKRDRSVLACALGMLMSSARARPADIIGPCDTLSFGRVNPELDTTLSVHILWRLPTPIPNKQVTWSRSPRRSLLRRI